MKRLPITLLTILTLFGVFRIYALVLSPMTQPRLLPVTPPTNRIEGKGHTSHSSREAASKHLATHPWAQSARYTWEKLNEKYIFFNDGGPVASDGRPESRNQWQFSPFALIVMNPKRPDQAPTILTAGEARITFLNRIDQLSTGDSGDNRIIGAELGNGVELSGPDGLYLSGTRFVFSEATRSLYSDEPVRFAFGPTADSASRFRCDAEDIAITLEAGNSDHLGKDLPRIIGFEHLVLRRNVRFSVDYAHKGGLTPVRVTSGGSFRFDRSERRASLDRDVEIVQRTSADGEPEKFNRLNCQRLEMFFDEVAGPPEPILTAEDKKPSRSRQKQEFWEERLSSFTNLSLHFLKAFVPAKRDDQDQRVVFRSDANNLTASMEQMSFDAFRGELFLNDPVQCRITLEDPEKGTATELLTRRMLIGMQSGQPEAEPAAPTAEPGKLSIRNKVRSFDQLEWVVCAGLGKLVHWQKDQADPAMIATWNERLHLQPIEGDTDLKTAERTLELSGATSVMIGIDRKVDAEHLTLTLTPELFDPTSKEKSDGALPVRRVQANGNIAFHMPEFEGTSEEVDLVISAGVPPVLLQQQSRDKSGKSPLANSRTQPAVVWTGHVDRVQANVLYDAATREAGMTHAVLDGRLNFRRPELVKNSKELTDGPVQIVGHTLTMTNSGGQDQKLTLAGLSQPGVAPEPARISMGSASLEGRQIDVNRAYATLTVQGQTQVCWPLSAIQKVLPVEESAGGQSSGSSQPMLMTVRSDDGVRFDGQTAHFNRNVRVLLGDDSRLYCEELIASLDRPLDLENSKSKEDQPQISLIRSPSRVRVDLCEYDKTRISRRMIADLGKVDVYPLETDGRFKGAGPGVIQHWQRGGTQFGVSQVTSASANRPSSSTDLPWSYTHLSFEGELSGNLHQRLASFSQRVKVTYAPVSQAGTAFVRSELSSATESAKRAVWMGCDLLEVSLSEPHKMAPNGFLTLNAQGHTELEGRTIHATAHQISFEEAKDTFMLRGRGDEMANVYFDGEPGTNKSRGNFPGSTITVNRRTQEIKVDKAGTITGAN